MLAKDIVRDVFGILLGLRFPLVQIARTAVLIVALIFSHTPGNAESPVGQRWQPVPDNIFLQEVGRKVNAPAALTSVAVFENKVFAGSANGLFQLRDSELTEVSAVRQPVRRLVIAKAGLWFLTSRELLRFQNNSWEEISFEPVADL